MEEELCRVRDSFLCMAHMGESTERDTEICILVQRFLGKWYGAIYPR